MQITGGSIQLELGSNVVTGTSVDWSQVLPGNYLIVSGSLFEIVSIDLTTVPTHPTLTLVDNWPSADRPAETNYVISRDFTSNHGIPMLNAGDLEAAALFTRAMVIIDGLLGNAGSTTNETQLTKTAHGFQIGDAIRRSGSTWVRASSGNSTTSLIVGIVSAIVDANTFKIKTEGYITGIGPTLVDGTVYYLKDILVDGVLNLTSNLLEVGGVTVPVLMATSSNSGYILTLGVAQTAIFAEGVDGLVPGPPSDDGTLFLRDDGWSSAVVGANTINLSHLLKTGAVDWTNWLTGTGGLSVYTHINYLKSHIDTLETAVGVKPYTRRVWTRKNEFFSTTDDDDVLPFTVPAEVNTVVVTLIGGFVPIPVPAIQGLLSQQTPLYCPSIRLVLDTSVRKLMQINVGLRPSYQGTPRGKAAVKLHDGSSYVDVGRIELLIPGNSTAQSLITTIGDSITGVIVGQQFLTKTSSLRALYRSVEKDPSVSDTPAPSWGYDFDLSLYDILGLGFGDTTATGIINAGTVKAPTENYGHCGAVIIEYGHGAVMGVV